MKTEIYIQLAGEIKTSLFFDGQIPPILVGPYGQELINQFLIRPSNPSKNSNIIKLFDNEIRKKALTPKINHHINQNDLLLLFFAKKISCKSSAGKLLSPSNTIGAGV